MRKLFLLGLGTFAAMVLGSAAQAADMPLKAPPPPPPPMYNWTGFYIGGHIGGAWADRNGNDRFDGENRCFWGGGESGYFCFDENHGFGRNNGRFIGGGQIGFNYQVNQWVWGVEGQISAIGSSNNDDACGFVTFNEVGRDHLFNCGNRGNWIASIAARLGVTFGQTGNWLLYVKGGGAFADSRFGVRLRDDCAAVFNTYICDPNNFAFNNNDSTRTGWMVGVGLEYGAWGNWSWKLEYNFMDFGHRNIHFDNAVLNCDCDIIRRDLNADLSVSVVKFGLNYRFGAAPAAPVAARY
jgi:outer membrane immunogenic protein